MERKLTAILCGDVYSYSRLMGDDEEATFRTLASHRKLAGHIVIKAFSFARTSCATSGGTAVPA